MKTYLPRVILFISLLLVVKLVRPQNAAIQVKGKVVSATNGQGLEFATIMLVNPLTEEGLGRYYNRYRWRISIKLAYQRFSRQNQFYRL